MPAHAPADARRRAGAGPPRRPSATPSPCAARPTGSRRTWRRHLAVPTATSVRTVPARLLEINRAALNEHLARTSSTRSPSRTSSASRSSAGLEHVPSLNSTYVDAIDDKGTPGVVHHDARRPRARRRRPERPDGTRTLFVPVVEDADTLDFAAFVLAYEDLVRKVLGGKARPTTSPGRPCRSPTPARSARRMSVPRLMAGQGAIFGVGCHRLARRASTPPIRAPSAELGVGKVLTLTSTYDHRIIQGAESGAVPAPRRRVPPRRARLLRRDLRGPGACPTSPRAGAPTSTRPPTDVEPRRVAQARPGAQAHQHVPRPRPPDRAPRPARRRAAGALPRARPRPLRPHHLGPRAEFVDRRPRGGGVRDARGDPRDPARRRTAARSAIEYMHIQDPEQKLWIQRARRGRHRGRPASKSSATCSSG